MRALLLVPLAFAALAAAEPAPSPPCAGAVATGCAHVHVMIGLTETFHCDVYTGGLTHVGAGRGGMDDGVYVQPSPCLHR